MNKLEEKIASIKQENNQINMKIGQLNQEREKLISQALINNGRILTMEEFMQEDITGGSDK